MLVRTHDGTVDVLGLPIERPGRIRLRLQGGQDAIPEPDLAPTIETGEAVDQGP